jgi:hypothetical protein
VELAKVHAAPDTSAEGSFPDGILRAIAVTMSHFKDGVLASRNTLYSLVYFVPFAIIS